MQWHALVPVVISTLLSLGLAEAASIGVDIRAQSETVYVPAYSHIHTHQKIRQPLASTLVVHNVDPKIAIVLVSVHYRDRDGNKVKDFLSEPTALQPFQSTSFLTPISERAGGVGANYIVEWRAFECVLPPVVDAVMIGGSGTHGISFVSPGRVIQRNGDCK